MHSQKKKKPSPNKDREERKVSIGRKKILKELREKDLEGYYDPMPDRR